MSRASFILLFGLLAWIVSASAAPMERDLVGEIKFPPELNPTDLFVYLANPPPSPKSSPLPAAVINQQNQTYHPHVSAIVKGTAVQFLNSDRVTHNVFSQSPTKVFDLGVIAPNTFRQVTFEKPGVVEVLCGFHSRMLAYIRVMEHPYFAVPDSRGRFTIKGVPPGKYQLRVWHESLGEIAREVMVSAAPSLPVQLHFPK